MSAAGGSLPRVTFVLGGARSGKSAFAERLLADVAQPVYVATAEIADAELRERVRVHRERRGARWRTVEEPLALGEALIEHAVPPAAILVDCLTLWLGNLVHRRQDVRAATETLCATLTDVRAPVVLVSNEVGLGIVPDNAAARRFRDDAGDLHAAVAALADRVYFVTAGIAHPIKG